MTTHKKAPAFTLKNQDNEDISLSDFLGKKVLLYMYPKDNTPGCTIEAKRFQESLAELTKRGVQVIGMSADSASSHKSFCEKQGLTFPLVSDPTKETLRAYGVIKEKKMFGKMALGIARESFLIDEQGLILKHYKTVKPDTHVREILADLDAR